MVRRLPTDQDPDKLAIAAALRELDRALDQFLQSLLHEGARASTEHERHPKEALRQACDAYAALSYASDQDVNETVTCLGVIGANAAVIARAEDLNAAKAKLRDACKRIQDQRVRIPVKDGQGGRVVKSVPRVRVILRELQRSDLNLLAAYRKIPLLTGRVARVAYVQARTRAVYRKSCDEIRAMLRRLDSPRADADLVHLQRLPERETHLALVEERYANVRANVTFHGLDARNRGRVMVAAELPLLYPMGRSKDLPDIRYPADGESASLPTRQRTGKLEAEPYLSSLPVYRYLPSRRPGRPRG